MAALSAVLLGNAVRTPVVQAAERGAISLENPGPTRSAGSDPGGTAAGAEPWRIIGGDSTCPRPDAVWAEVTTLVPREHLEERIRGPGAIPRIEIIDLGAPYRVIAAGRVREYRDDGRDCTHRAHVAAVFVALVLDPPSFALPPSVPGPAVVAAVVPAEVQSHAVLIELGAATGAGASADHLVLWGAGVRVIAGRESVALTVGATALAPTETTVNGLRVRQLRAPADAGLRARLRTQQTEISGELGLTLAFLSEQALNLAASNRRSTTEIGVRAAVAWRLSRSARVAPFVAVSAEIVPRPTALFALPRGVVGHTPTGWIGAQAGVSWGL